MVVAGPNGAGKSTLLNHIRNVGGNQHILYVGPHRAIRRQSVQQRYLISTRIDLEQILASENVPGYEGVKLFGGSRNPWDADDSSNYLKHALCQIEIERQQAIAARYDKDNQIVAGSIADPWKPLRELTNNLLPHLAFDRIDNSNRDNIRCLWKVHSKNTTVDFDDLSSGEKSVVQMFYPLVENQVRALLEEIQSGQKAAARPETCVLIDEPELHLHPNLQVKVFDYLRLLSASGSMQVILATHSPTIVEHASFDELFLLRPIELVPTGENQLVQVADNEEKLKFLRDVFGTTSNLTAMQPVIIVEGISEKTTSSAMADRKLYRALHKGFDGVTLLPGGGKFECLRLVKTLNEVLPTFSVQLEAFALLDRDLDERPDDPHVHLLSVSMIENFLLDPLPIWESIQSVVEKTSFKTIDDIAAALDTALTKLEPDEIERRAKSALGMVRFRPESPIQQTPAKAEEFSKAVLARYSVEAVNLAGQKSAEQVASIRAESRRRERFHGKSALDSFYGEHLHQTGLAKPVFKFEAARHARERKAVLNFFDEFFKKLKKPDPLA